MHPDAMRGVKPCTSGYISPTKARETHRTPEKNPGRIFKDFVSLFHKIRWRINPFRIARTEAAEKAFGYFSNLKSIWGASTTGR
ncbi:hypothetical protein P4S72_28715 [Vibrio sp. PP-XX7]